jgi:hypothetical protein
VCGDGHVNLSAGEVCDDGAQNGTAQSTCSATCHLVTCGNGVLEQGEQCDDGANNGPNNRCNNCRLNVCGDGNTLTGVEQCDDGVGGVRTDSATCDNDCTFAVCGDGHLNLAAGEFCDDGAKNGTSQSTCSATCHLVTCGNGVLEQGEQCDDGANNGPTNRCNNCRFNVCGDGNTLTGVEQCDDGVGGARTDSPTCDNDCTFALCGDGHLNLAAGEFCDDGAKNGTSQSTCSTTCHLVACGNGVLEQGEQCDDGASNGSEVCPYGPTSCKVCDATCHIVAGSPSFCGDGVSNGPEKCDDGNTSCGACSSDCQVVTSAPALGAISVPAGDSFQTGDTFVLSDGVTVAIFQFKVVSNASPVLMAPTLDIIPVTITNSTLNGPESSHDIATAIADAINDPNNHLQITAQPQAQNAGTTILGLTHKLKTSNGNQPIVGSFANPSAFQVSGMAGGEGGNCAATQACTKDADCASFHCNNIPPSVGVCL